MIAHDQVYFAADDSEKAASYLIEKSQQWFRHIQLNNYMEKMKKSWMSYHGIFYQDSHEISFGGEQGELVNLAVNHYANLCQHTLNMVTGARPSFQCRAVNTDRKSKIQAELGNGLLEYYMREKRLEREIKRAVEYSIVLGSGYIKMEWNSTRGRITDVIEPDPSSIAGFNEDDEPIDENGNVIEPMPIYEGDVEFTTLSPQDVVFDPTKENPELHEWVICRSFVNRHNLIKKYPEYEELIRRIETKDVMDGRKMGAMPFDVTEDVPIYEFYHEQTEAVPEGRYMLYLTDEIILEDGPMPYRNLPVYRIAPRDILGTPFGYTGLWDILPLQDAINSLYSTLLTNNNAFGVQNILNPQGNNIKVNQLEGGLNFIEYNQAAGKPEALQLTASAPETYNFLQMIERVMETISGINAVARGNPQDSLRSGTSLALIQTQALQFMSGLQQSYIQLLEDVGTGLIHMLQDYAETPRIAAIAGLSNTAKLKEFKSEDIEDISRVYVDVGNALAQTTAGRLEILTNMLQMGLQLTPEKYLEIMNTGNLKSATQGMTDELDVITAENEALLRGDEVIAIATDYHSKHIAEHRDVLADPELRKDPELVRRTLAHIEEHLNLQRTTDPDLLAMIKEQALAPLGGSPVGPQPQGAVTQAPGSNPMAAPAAPVGPDGLPQPAQPPAGFEGAPQTPADLMAKNTGGM